MRRLLLPDNAEVIRFELEETAKLDPGCAIILLEQKFVIIFRKVWMLWTLTVHFAGSCLVLRALTSRAFI
jgi:hypothetical protein